MKAQTVRQPPQNIDAEMSVIGALLLGKPGTIAELEEMGFHPSQFYRMAHNGLYMAIRGLEEAGVAVDAVTVKNKLVEMNLYDSIGGASYLMAVGNITPTTANVKHYAKIVMDRAAERLVIEKAANLQALAYDGGREAKELLAIAEQEIFSIRDNVPHAASDDSDMAASIGKVLSGMMKPPSGIFTGYRELDGYLKGIKPGEVCVIGGLTGDGKTALAASVAVNVAENSGTPSTIYNFEMLQEQMASRLLSQLSRVDGAKFRMGHESMDEEEIGRVAEAAKRLVSLPIVVADTRDMDIGALRANARRRVRQYGTKLIVVDHLGEVKPEHSWQSTERETKETMHHVKSMAMELEVPVIVLCQFSREIRHRADKRPVLSDLRDSGTVEQKADIVLLLHNQKGDFHPEGDPEPVEVIIAKNRGSRTGSVNLFFEKQYTRYTEKENRREYVEI